MGGEGGGWGEGVDKSEAEEPARTVLRRGCAEKADEEGSVS